MIQRLGAFLPDQFKTIVLCVKETQAAEAVVKTLLSEPLKSNCWVQRMEQGCLTLAVADAVWLMSLRYELPNLRDRLRCYDLFRGLCSIDLTVQPEMYELEKKTRTRVERVISPAVRALINKTSEQIEYEPLSQMLRQLAKRE